MKIKIKIIFFILLSIIMIFVNNFSKDFPENKTSILSKQFLQNRIGRKFPINKSFFIGNIKLYNPIITLKNDRIYVEVEYNSSIFLSKSAGKIYFNSKVAYNTKNEKLYLANAQIEKIVTKDGEVSKNTSLMKKIILEYISKNPVYQYRKEKPNTKVKVKRMYIENGMFYVQT